METHAYFKRWKMTKSTLSTNQIPNCKDIQSKCIYRFQKLSKSHWMLTHCYRVESHNDNPYGNLRHSNRFYLIESLKFPIPNKIFASQLMLRFYKLYEEMRRREGIEPIRPGSCAWASNLMLNWKLTKSIQQFEYRS